MFGKKENCVVCGNVVKGSHAKLADELKKYKELLDLGAITVGEYNAKKSQLLNL